MLKNFVGSLSEKAFQTSKFYFLDQCVDSFNEAKYLNSLSDRKIIGLEKFYEKLDIAKLSPASILA